MKADDIVTAYVGLGSNMGHKIVNIRRAIAALQTLAGVQVQAVAPFYRTAPWGNQEQEWFVNTVAELTTTLPARSLLQAMLDIEQQMGRVREVTWGPRVIDLDLLLYHRSIINEPDLTVPHPYMLERAFVMVPLADLNPDLIMAGGSTAKDMADLLKQGQPVQRLE